ncbi:MAG: DUF6580 family putative transport protein [Bacteroidota bacterium]
MKRSNINILLAIFLVLIAATARIVNREMGIYNIAPLTAISLFCGMAMKDKRALAFLVPLMGQFVADVFFQFFTKMPGFYPGQLFNYGGLVAATALGTTMKQPKVLNTFAYLFGASTVFFIISNLGYFAAGWNGYTAAGLTKTYADAVPFYKNTLVGDMVGGILLFGSYVFAQRLFVAKAVKARA